MTDQTIFLAPTSNETAIKHLQQSVEEGITPSKYERHLDTEKIPADDSPISIWGTKRAFADRHEFKYGDIMLFYTGDGKYTKAGVIQDSEINEELAELIWGVDESNATESEDPWSHILYLDDPIAVDIDGSEIANYADYNIDYVLGLQPLNDQGHREIRDAYSDIPSFIIEKSPQSAEEIYQNSPILKDIAGQCTAPEVPNEDTAIKKGLKTANRWQGRYDILADVLNRSHQVLVRGTTAAVSRAQMQYFAAQWLDESNGDIQNRIIEFSIDSHTTYEDAVEQIRTNSETNTGITTTDGVFKQACRFADALKNEAEYEGEPIPRYVLLLDLHDNATLSDSLGPISYLLDPDSRRREAMVQLPHTGKTLRIPDNLYIIAVDSGLNLLEIPAETRRRFRLIEYDPDIDLLSEIYTGQSVSQLRQDGAPTEGDSEVVEQMIFAIQKLNQRLQDHDETISSIGQDRFIAYDDTAETGGQYDPAVIMDIWNYELLPYLHNELENPSQILQDIPEMDVLLI